MRIVGRKIKWLALLPAIYIAWFAGRYYQGMQADCYAAFDKFERVNQEGQRSLYGSLDINLSKKQNHYEVFAPSGELVWAGTVYLRPNLNWAGNIVSLTVKDIVSSVPSAGLLDVESLSKGKTYPFSYERIDDRVAWLRLGGLVTFCTRP